MRGDGKLQSSSQSKSIFNETYLRKMLAGSENGGVAAKFLIYNIHTKDMSSMEIQDLSIFRLNPDGSGNVIQTIYKPLSEDLSLPEKRTVSEEHLNVSATKIEVLPGKKTTASWEQFLKATIPESALRNYYVFFPQLMVFSAKSWQGAIGGSALNGVINGCKTNSISPYGALRTEDAMGKPLGHVEYLKSLADGKLKLPETGTGPLGDVDKKPESVVPVPDETGEIRVPTVWTCKKLGFIIAPLPGTR